MSPEANRPLNAAEAQSALNYVAQASASSDRPAHSLEAEMHRSLENINHQL
jgi:hypothetical protein